jgi:TRAP-type C4-dicarboxylate transport system permease small subunit
MMKKITEKIVTIKGKGAELEKEIREKTMGYIITSFGLVAGLAWNDAIKAFIERFFVEPGDGLKAKFLYAAIMTVFVVSVSLYLARIFRVEKKKDKKEIETVTTTKEVTSKDSKEKK